jgi:hypothetical protein
MGRPFARIADLAAQDDEPLSRLFQLLEPSRQSISYDRVKIRTRQAEAGVRYELAKRWLTGERIDVGETHQLMEPHRQ